MRVLRCGHPEMGSKFCPECGAEALAEGPAPDPFIGRMIGERYRVTELANVGGMGRVYRAVQTSLDRPVAIKLIHPHLLTSEDVVARFFNEARAASRLNHPNVVSIYDFGRVPASDGGHLHLVMELLSGRDLRALLAAKTLSFKEIADILRQTLAALGEAHHHGITHRDVKPENILLETRRGDAQHVKVIDFGIARIGGEARRTQAGRVFGTPWYMAPEQAAGRAAGPAADLYAVGVILFEMLAGRVPFDDEAPSQILVSHMRAPRPDPRAFAPERRIPDELAAVCARALAIAPEERYEDAEAFAAALVHGATREAWSANRSSMFPKRRSAAPSASAPLAARGLAETAALESRTGAHASAGAPLAAPLVGRDAELAATRDLVASPGEATALVLHGRAGIGRTRLLRAVVDAQRAVGARVTFVRAAPRPAGERSFGGLAALVPALAGATAEELIDDARGADDAAVEGMRAIFLHDVAPERTTEDVRRAVTAALAWAAATSVQRAGGARALFAIDDVHEMDAASQLALEDLLERGAPRGPFVVMTTENAPELGPASRIRAREVKGLSAADAARVLGGAPLVGAADDLEPAYLDALARWRRSDAPDPASPAPPERDAPPRDDAPATLAEIVAASLERLPPAQQRVVQALAVAGAVSPERLAEILPRDGALDDALVPLLEAGLVERELGDVRLRNALYGRVALGSAPAGAIADLHERARATLEGTPRSAELRAYHALRAEPSFDTFMAVEGAARIRGRCGNDEATVALLWDAMSVAREHELRGEAEAQIASSARIVFGRKLGEALINVGRLEQAQGVLSEVLELTAPRDITRAAVLERLAIIALHRGRPAEAEQRRVEALAVADRAGDRALVARLRDPLPRIESAPPRRIIFKTPGVGIHIPRSAPPKGRTAERA